MERPPSPKLAQIAADHCAVGEGMRRIQSELDRLRQASSALREWSELGQLLRGFHGLLKEHFAREECDDFLGQGIPWDPMARDRIDQLISQHRRFLAVLDRLVAELEGFSGERLDGFAGETENLFTNLRWHDAVETGLLHRLTLFP